MDVDGGAGAWRTPGRARFDVRVRPGTADGVVVLELGGELDHDTVAPLREAVEEHARARRIVVDCSGLDFCDSTGLNALLKARLRMRETGGRLDLAGLRPPVDRMFDITGVRAVFRVYEDTDRALADPAPHDDGAGRE
ncbi:STAS domain-containing protein [Streptomyces sp. NPDC000961]|uniref:STAS domain-containing protein n=1 Tax=Streptomyces sp. NPDC000961 TaxID=3364541 RepID=UPI00367880D0